MQKKVKITVSGRPLTCTPAPLIPGTHGPMVLDTDYIFKSIISGAKVVEIFDDPEEIRELGCREVVLDLTNYNTNNKPSISRFKETKEPEQKKETTVAEPINMVAIKSEEEHPSKDAIKEEEVKVEAKSPEHWMPPKRDNNKYNKKH